MRKKRVLACPDHVACRATTKSEETSCISANCLPTPCAIKVNGTILIKRL